MTADGKGPEDPKQMADPKLVLEADPDDLVLESIPPDQDGDPKPALHAAASAMKPAAAARGPVLPVPRPAGFGARPPPPAPGSGSGHDKPPPPPPRGTPASGVSPRSLGPNSDNLETIPAPPREVGSSKWRVPTSPGHDRSSVTARESLPRQGQVPSLPGGGTQAAAPLASAPLGSPPGGMPSATPAGGTTRSQLGGGSVTGATAMKASGAFSASSYSGVHQQSALVRMLSPFIEDPRPRWLLATYFLVGVAIGLGAAFGLWGQR